MMVEMYVVIYDKLYTEETWQKITLLFPHFDYILSHCDGIGDLYELLNTWGDWEDCEEPTHIFQSSEQSVKET